MRIEASATAITWLPFAALDRLHVVPLELAVAHYDEPPPEVVPDLDELRRQDAFREANELRAWVEIDEGKLVDYGQTGRGLIGDGLELEAQQVSFAAVEFPVIQPEPEVGDGWVRFTQTAGGRIGLPAPRPVVGRPYFHVGAVSAWTTLELLMRADGTSETRLVAASPFPRHSLYASDRRLVDVFGAVELELGDGTPWGDERTPAFAAAVESELERRLAATILRDGVVWHAARRSSSRESRATTYSCSWTGSSTSRSTARSWRRSVPARSWASGPCWETGAAPPRFARSGRPASP
jgi:hypothetical protein